MPIKVVPCYFTVVAQWHAGETANVAVLVSAVHYIANVKVVAQIMN